MDDKDFVKQILFGDPSSWKEFVENYTDWVLYTAWEFERKFCRRPARKGNCSLLIIMRQRKGNATLHRKNGEDCDEGLELYLWLFKQLRERLKSYRGESKLSTYIWTILNSHALHVDILRWKYGRVDEFNAKRLPAAIKALPETERKLFVMLRRRKGKEFILQGLGLAEEGYQQALERVRTALLQAGQMDLLDRPGDKEFEPLEDDAGQLSFTGQFGEQETRLVDRIFYRQIADHLRQALGSLGSAERKLLLLYYQQGLSGREIGTFCSQMAPPLEIDGVEVNSQNVYYILGKVSERLLAVMNLEIDGQRLSREQWLKAISVFAQEEAAWNI